MEAVDADGFGLPSRSTTRPNDGIYIFEEKDVNNTTGLIWWDGVPQPFSFIPSWSNSNIPSNNFNSWIIYSQLGDANDISKNNFIDKVDKSDQSILDSHSTTATGLDHGSEIDFGVPGDHFEGRLITIAVAWRNDSGDISPIEPKSIVTKDVRSVQDIMTTSDIKTNVKAGEIDLEITIEDDRKEDIQNNYQPKPSPKYADWWYKNENGKKIIFDSQSVNASSGFKHTFKTTFEPENIREFTIGVMGKSVEKIAPSLRQNVPTGRSKSDETSKGTDAIGTLNNENSLNLQGDVYDIAYDRQRDNLWIVDGQAGTFELIDQDSLSLAGTSVSFPSEMVVGNIYEDFSWAPTYDEFIVLDNNSATLYQLDADFTYIDESKETGVETFSSWAVDADGKFIKTANDTVDVQRYDYFPNIDATQLQVDIYGDDSLACDVWNGNELISAGGGGTVYIFREDNETVLRSFSDPGIDDGGAVTYGIATDGDDIAWTTEIVNGKIYEVKATEKIDTGTRRDVEDNRSQTGGRRDIE